MTPNSTEHIHTPIHHRRHQKRRESLQPSDCAHIALTVGGCTTKMDIFLHRSDNHQNLQAWSLGHPLWVPKVWLKNIAPRCTTDVRLYWD
jgi:hypothetical protein